MSRILIIEEEPALLGALEDNFRFESYEVLTAQDGETGFRLVKDTKPDLLILDLTLPRMSGYDVCRRLRGEHVLELTRKEFQLLRLLAERAPDVITRDELPDEIWGQDCYPTTRTVDTHVANLRVKPAAEALFRIGERHQALGNAEARRTFERLVRKFSDQTEVASRARDKLAALSAPEPRPKFTKIRVPTKLPRATANTLSPDGKRIGLVFPSPETTVIYTMPASGGKAGQLTPKDALMPSWTPDGKQIHFDGCHLGECGQIEFIPASGGSVSRIPMRGPRSLFVFYPTGGISVSPDGAKILFAGGFHERRS